MRQQRWFGCDFGSAGSTLCAPVRATADGDGASVQRCAEDLLGYWSRRCSRLRPRRYRGPIVLRLTKFHGLGNDFLIALAADHPDAEHP